MAQKEVKTPEWINKILQLNQIKKQKENENKNEKTKSDLSS